MFSIKPSDYKIGGRNVTLRRACAVENICTSQKIHQYSTICFTSLGLFLIAQMHQTFYSNIKCFDKKLIILHIIPITREIKDRRELVRGLGDLQWWQLVINAKSVLPR